MPGASEIEIRLLYEVGRLAKILLSQLDEMNGCFWRKADIGNPRPLRHSPRVPAPRKASQCGQSPLTRPYGLCRWNGFLYFIRMGFAIDVGL